MRFQEVTLGQVVVGAMRTSWITVSISTQRRSKFARLVGVNGRGGKTDELVAMLRGYDEDVADPGLK